MHILDPDQQNPLDVDPQQAVRTRRQWLRWAAQREALFLAAQFGADRFPIIGERGQDFIISSWQPLN